MPDEYCELHAHSNFSFLDGASHPEELIARAAVLGMPALAVTDHAGLYAAVRLWKAAAQTRTEAARDAGLAPVSAIIGLELAIPARRGRAAPGASRPEAERPAARREGEPRLARRAPRRADARRPPGPAGPRRHRLRRAVAARLARPPGGGEAVPVFERALVEAALDEARGHLVGLSGCRNGEVPRQLLAGERDAALDAAQALGRPLPGWRLRGRAEPPPAAGRRLARGPARRAGGARRPAHGGHQRGALRRCRAAIGCRTCWSASATAPPWTRRASCSCPTPSTGSRSGAELARIGAGLPDARSQPRLGGRHGAGSGHRPVVPAGPGLRALSVPGLHGPRGRDGVLIPVPACARGLTAPLSAHYQAGASSSWRTSWTSSSAPTWPSSS